MNFLADVAKFPCDDEQRSQLATMEVTKACMAPVHNTGCQLGNAQQGVTFLGQWNCNAQVVLAWSLRGAK